MKYTMYTYIRLVIVFLLAFSHVPVANAAPITVPFMPQPGALVHLSPNFTPAHLKGMTVHPENALQFDFLMDKGQDVLNEEVKKEEYTKIIKYFLASLTIPDKDQWVNLSPYESGRIIENNFGKTEMGRDLLAQDYLLKQITSSMMYPESSLGKNFWDKVYERAYKELGNTNIPVNTINKVWIMPEEAVVYESNNSVIILKSHLKVMLEEDYLAANVIASGAKQSKIATMPKASRDDTSAVIRDIILPELEKEVNEGKNFAQLRQIVSAMVLATWYKQALKESILGKVYADKAKVDGVDLQSSVRAVSENPETIYQKYLDAFKKGVYNYVKEDADKYTNQIVPRKYFAGGFAPLPGIKVLKDSAMSGRYSPAAQEERFHTLSKDFVVKPQGVESVSTTLEVSDPNQVNTAKNGSYFGDLEPAATTSSVPKKLLEAIVDRYLEKLSTGATLREEAGGEKTGALEIDGWININDNTFFHRPFIGSNGTLKSFPVVIVKDSQGIVRLKLGTMTQVLRNVRSAYNMEGADVMMKVIMDSDFSKSESVREDLRILNMALEAQSEEIFSAENEDIARNILEGLSKSKETGLMWLDLNKQVFVPFKASANFFGTFVVPVTLHRQWGAVSLKLAPLPAATAGIDDQDKQNVIFKNNLKASNYWNNEVLKKRIEAINRKMRQQMMEDIAYAIAVTYVGKSKKQEIAKGWGWLNFRHVASELSPRLTSVVNVNVPIKLEVMKDGDISLSPRPLAESLRSIENKAIREKIAAELESNKYESDAALKEQLDEIASHVKGMILALFDMTGYYSAHWKAMRKKYEAFREEKAALRKEKGVELDRVESRQYDTQQHSIVVSDKQEISEGQAADARFAGQEEGVDLDNPRPKFSEKDWAFAMENGFDSYIDAAPDSAMNAVLKGVTTESLREAVGGATNAANDSRKLLASNSKLKVLVEVERIAKSVAVFKKDFLRAKKVANLKGVVDLRDDRVITGRTLNEIATKFNITEKDLITTYAKGYLMPVRFEQNDKGDIVMTKAEDDLMVTGLTRSHGYSEDHVLKQFNKEFAKPEPAKEKISVKIAHAIRDTFQPTAMFFKNIQTVGLSAAIKEFRDQRNAKLEEENDVDGDFLAEYSLSDDPLYKSAARRISDLVEKSTVNDVKGLFNPKTKQLILGEDLLQVAEGYAPGVISLSKKMNLFRTIINDGFLVPFSASLRKNGFEITILEKFDGAVFNERNNQHVEKDAEHAIKALDEILVNITKEKVKEFQAKEKAAHNKPVVAVKPVQPVVATQPVAAAKPVVKAPIAFETPYSILEENSGFALIDQNNKVSLARVWASAMGNIVYEHVKMRSLFEVLKIDGYIDAQSGIIFMGKSNGLGNQIPFVIERSGVRGIKMVLASQRVPAEIESFVKDVNISLEASKAGKVLRDDQNLVKTRNSFFISQDVDPMHIYIHGQEYKITDGKILRYEGSTKGYVNASNPQTVLFKEGGEVTFNIYLDVKKNVEGKEFPVVRIEPLDGAIEQIGKLKYAGSKVVSIKSLSMMKDYREFLNKSTQDMAQTASVNRNDSFLAELEAFAAAANADKDGLQGSDFVDLVETVEMWSPAAHAVNESIVPADFEAGLSGRAKQLLHFSVGESGGAQGYIDVRNSQVHKLRWNQEVPDSMFQGLDPITPELAKAHLDLRRQYAEVVQFRLTTERNKPRQLVLSKKLYKGLKVTERMRSILEGFVEDVDMVNERLNAWHAYQRQTQVAAKNTSANAGEVNVLDQDASLTMVMTTLDNYALGHPMIKNEVINGKGYFAFAPQQEVAYRIFISSAGVRIEAANANVHPQAKSFFDAVNAKIPRLVSKDVSPIKVGDAYHFTVAVKSTRSAVLLKAANKVLRFDVLEENGEVRIFEVRRDEKVLINTDYSIPLINFYDADNPAISRSMDGMLKDLEAAGMIKRDLEEATIRMSGTVSLERIAKVLNVSGSSLSSRQEAYARLMQEFRKGDPHDITYSQAPDGKLYVTFRNPFPEVRVKVFSQEIEDSAKGGIDLNSEKFNLKIKRDGRGVPLPLPQQDMSMLNSINGFVPRILEIKPADQLPIFAEMSQKLGSLSNVSTAK